MYLWRSGNQSEYIYIHLTRLIYPYMIIITGHEEESMISRQLTRKERTAIKNLIKTMCANYDRAYDCCPLLDDYSCYQLTQQFTGCTCRYYQEAVLPLNSSLQAAFYPDCTRCCCMCGDGYIPTGRSQKYCPSCKVEMKKLAAAKRAKSYRDRKRSNVTLLS